MKLLIAFALIPLCSSVAVVLTEQEQKVYVQDATIENYLFKFDLPAMDDFTYCLWLNMEDGINSCYPASISSRSHKNQHLYGWYKLDQNDPTTYIAENNKMIKEILLSQDLITAVKNGWHKHCFVNKKGEYIKWFMDRETPGVVEEIQSTPSVAGIPEGSALILLQEQDSFKGGLVLSQVCQSKMSMFNMWDKAMTLPELNDLRCQDKGTVVNMENIGSMGVAPEYESSPFPCRRDQEENVYVQNGTIDNYLFKFDLPAMDDFTYCLWLNMEDGINTCYPASISSGSHYNQHLYGWYKLDQDDPTTYIAENNKMIKEILLSQDLITAVKNGWHKHCFVNKKGEYIKWFMDRETPGVVEEIQSTPAVAGIPEGSALILLQEQDSFKGGLVLSQVCRSKMSMFNMWNKAMTQTELNDLRCRNQGNIVNMSNMDSMGPPQYVMETFPCFFA